MTTEQRPSGCAGVILAALIGVALPAILLAFHAGQNAFTYYSPSSKASFFFSNLGNLLMLGGLYATPGALVLGGLLMRFLSGRLHQKLVTRREHFWTGIILGALIAFLNLPCYLVAYLFPSSVNQVALILRVACLFAVTGATCGLCIAWQLWMAYHPDEKPRFSLGTLLLCVLAFAAIVAVFLPMPSGIMPPRP